MLEHGPRTVAGRAAVLGTLNPKLAHAATEGAGVEAQDGGGSVIAFDAPARLLEGTQDVLALEGFQASGGGSGGRRFPGCEPVGQGEHGAFRADDRPLDHVLQLADVAGPVVALELVHHSFGDLSDDSSETFAQAGHECGREQRDVFLALAKGGEGDGKHVDAVPEILPEASRPDLVLEVAVGRGDEAHVDRDRLRPSQPLELLVLQDAQELSLELEGKLPDFVQEERAAVGQLEAARLPGEGAREGPALVAEELAFDEVGRQGGAIDLDERPLPASAGTVNRPGDQLLARAGFSEDEGGRIGGGNLIHLVEHVFQCIAAADDLLKIVYGADFLLEVGTFGFELRFVALDRKSVV